MMHMSLVSRVQFLISDARKWSVGRVWIWRVLILFYLSYAGYTHVMDPNATDLFGAVTLGVHELGHLLTSWCPDIVMIASGSALQVLVPIFLVIGFLRQRDYFS